MFSNNTEDKVSRSGRARCYKARDDFYRCVKESGVLYSSTEPVPAKCAKLRGAFEAACLPSWVRHFDELQEKESRAARKVYNDIYQSAATSAGNLAGVAQK